MIIRTERWCNSATVIVAASPLVGTATSKVIFESLKTNSLFTEIVSLATLMSKLADCGAVCVFMAKALLGRGWSSFHRTQQVSFAAHNGEGA